LETARLLAGIDPKTLSEADRSALAQALKEYQTAQTALPDQPEGYNNLGQLAYHQGNSYEAIRRMKQAIAIDPHFIPAYQSLAVLYSQIGANDRAVDILQQALTHALPEQRGDLYYTLGLAYAERAQMKEARAALEQAVTHNPEYAAAHYNLGLVLQQLNEPDAAIKQLQQALAINTDDDRIRYALLQLLMQQKQYGQAQGLLNVLIRRYPNEPALQQMLVEIIQQQPR
jgi:tetratricopeptide (TPR) repeat protein